MARQPRFLPPNNYFHIMNRGNSGATLFYSDEDYQFYLDRLKDLKTEHPFDLIHYCLMDTHIHLLVKIKNGLDFSIFSKRLNLSYANYFKRTHGLVGHLWQGRFKSKVISSDSYLLQCGKYIELNSIRAGIAQNPEKYPWSSYAHYAYGEEKSIITDDIFYNQLGSNPLERQKAYQKLIISELVENDIIADKIVIGTNKFVYNINRRKKYHVDHKESPYRKSTD